MSTTVLYKICGMKKMTMTLILIFLLGLSLRAETSTISGTVINGNGFTIRLMTYSDQVSYLRETLISTMIGEDGKFTFTLEIDSVKFCWLDIEFQQAELFMQAGQHYEVEIELKNQSLSTSYYNRTGLLLRIIKDDDDHLNLSIQDFNQLYNDFMLNYAEKARTLNTRSTFDAFNNAINIRFQNSKNLYFQNYIKYKTASMQLFLRLKSRDNIGLEYFSGQPILYNNPEYMEFFHLFFEKYFLAGGKYLSFNKSYDLINGDATMTVILDSLVADPVLKDVEVRELLLLEGLKELYNVSGFKRDRILALVNEISTFGSTDKTKILADNLMIRLKRLQPGSPAPEFSLNGILDNKEYQLKDFSGRYIYLAFIDSANPACQFELGLIEDFYDDYKDKVAFIAISVDKDTGKVAEYLKSAKIPWLVLNYGGSLDLLEKYDASTFPHFLLINAAGQIVRCPAPSPSEDIQTLFSSI